MAIDVISLNLDIFPANINMPLHKLNMKSFLSRDIFRIFIVKARDFILAGKSSSHYEIWICRLDFIRQSFDLCIFFFTNIGEIGIHICTLFQNTLT